MGLEQRGGRSYYYEKKWKGGTCRSVYVGSGALAELCRLEAMHKRNREEIDNLIWGEEREAFERAEREAIRSDRDARTIITAALIASGYHQHKRQWRGYAPTRSGARNDRASTRTH
jgi:hypothetical protein